MKFRFLCLLSFIIPALPYFMPTVESYKYSNWINSLWFKGCFILLLVLIIILIIISIISAILNLKQKKTLNLKIAFKGIKQMSILILLSVFSYFQTDNIIEFWQIRKIERIVETNNLYDKDLSHLSDKLKKYNADSRWFLINYSEIYPKNNKSVAKIFYRKDLLLEGWDCRLYYSNEKPNSAPYKVIRKGKNGYNWYKLCNY